MAIIIFCLWSPSPKHCHDHHRHRLDTLISIVALLSYRQLLLPRLSLSLSDKVKQLQGDCIAYNKATTIWLLPVADNSVTKHDHLIQQIISHHVLTISHHNMPCKNKLDVLYFVVASFTWLLRACSKNRSYLRIKTLQKKTLPWWYMFVTVGRVFCHAGTPHDKFMTESR